MVDMMIIETLPENMLTPGHTRRIWKNICVIAVAFMVQGTAVNATVVLQSSINAEAGLGTSSLATLFVGSILSNILLTSVVIKWLGTKWSICCSFITYMPFIACQMYPRFYTLVPAAFILGLGAGPLYCSAATYLSMLAEFHSNLSKVPSGTMLLKFLGFFFMFIQMSQIWGNVISSLVISSANNASVTTLNDSIIPQICGANFLPNLNAAEALPSQPPEKIFMLAGIYLAFLCIATILVAAALDSNERYVSCSENTTTLSGLTLLAATVKQLRYANQSLLVPINIFVGLHQAFFFGDFTASFVSCAIGTGSLGYVMMVYGACDAAGCYITGHLAKKFGRLPVITSALFIHGGVLVTLMTWHPHVGDYYVMFIIAGCWGFCDSIWTLQINAYYGVLFRGEVEAAFSNFRLWEGIGYVTSFVLSPYVRTRYKICLLMDEEKNKMKGRGIRTAYFRFYYFTTFIRNLAPVKT